MKTIICSLIVWVSSGAALHAQEEWIDLLAPSELGEWSGDATLWRVEDGILIGEGAGGGAIERTAYTFHPLVAGDFILEGELRLTGGNSGIQYRSMPTADGDAIGYQADLDAANTYSGILYESGGRGILGKRGEITHANLRGGTRIGDLTSRAEAETAHQPGEWTRVRVIAIDDFIRQEINGIPTCEVVDVSKSALRRGRFAIQLHQGDAMKIEVRTLRVRLLQTGTPSADPTAPIADPPPLSLATPPPAVPLTSAGVSPPRNPHWIWGSASPGDGEHVTLAATVSLPKGVRAMHGVVTADNRFRLFLDDAPVAAGSDWSQPTKIDLGARGAGTMVLRAEVENEGGPAGFALHLTIEFEDASLATLETDARWSVLSDSAWSAAHDFGAVAEATLPWGDVFAERVAASPDTWELPPGFTAELLHSARPGEGSWASMVIEGPRRFIISPESGALLRVILPERAGDPVVTAPVADAIGNAQGLCLADGALFVHVSDTPARGGGLWRLDDVDGDGFYEEKKRFSSSGVRNEHGVHGIAAGPDGFLYLAIGNHVELPRELSPTDPYRNFAEDVLLPRIEDPNGHAVGIRAPAGQIVRVRPDGTGWERIAGGLRNPYDLAFHLDDELFTYDADMEWDIGAPWYRAPRVIHVTSGAEIGWRSGSAKWPDGIPDAVPPVVETDLSSPTGVASGLESNFPGRWGQALYLGDWAFGRILVAHLEEKGASWRGRVEVFCQGTPMNVTDCAFGSDGALYLTTGGRGTQSGLYRIRVTDRSLAATGRAPTPRNGEGEAERLRRRSLEKLHRVSDAGRIDEIWASLGDSDRAIRDAARIALERSPVELWRKRVQVHSEVPEDPARLRTAFLALARVGDALDRESVGDHLTHLPRPLTAEGDRIELRIGALLVTRSPEVTPWLRASLLIRFDPVFPSGEFSSDRLAAELLARLDAPRVIERILTRWQRTDRPDEQLHYARVLATVERGWTPDTRARVETLLAGLREVDGGHSLRGYVARITEELRARVGAEPLLPPAPIAIEIPPRVSEWLAEDLIALATAPKRSDDAERGRAAYEKALCSHCHRRSGIGGGIGPDLTGSAARYTPTDLVRAIVDPSRDISTQYEWTELETADDLFLGRVVGEDTKKIQLNTNAFDYEHLSIPKDSVRRREASPISPMPPGLMDALTEEEAGALLRWLRAKESGGSR